MARRNGWKRACGVLLLFAATAMISPAQTITTLGSFDGTDGANPYLMTLMQGTDGNFHGTTVSGGDNGSNCEGDVGCGTIFLVTPAGAVVSIYSFCAQTNCPDGDSPYGGLVQGTDGNFYGTTTAGGANCVAIGGCGTVFKLTPLGCCEGILTTLHSFCAQTNCTDGASPYAGLVQGTDGNFYGTTAGGSANGTIFKITSAGALTTLHTFDSTDGASPYAGLVQATNGILYGTTLSGGASANCSGGCGTVFKITTGGTFTMLHSLDSTDGANPESALVQATNGDLYGTTSQGGTNKFGTIFKITPAGVFTSLSSFCAQTHCPDGALPYAGLVQGTDGNLYGITWSDGADGVGTLFRITPAGAMTTLSSFNVGNSNGGLVQGTDGDFYGTTFDGGLSGNGAVFSLSMALKPFAKAQPGVGKVAAAITMLGTNLTGATGVSFDGTAAKFTVVSPSEITTTVPNGAKTGTVKVTDTSSGTLASNVAFRVTPQIKSFTPASGAAGTPVIITGVSLTQTSKVTFGGVTATSLVKNSDTKVTATVPTGAKTGKIVVTTTGGTATTGKSFTVTP
jgi:uncharacterized repeat protein (TIGR03803 family)